jgi:peptidoglycan/xylan/chitin deacetylase (PgdA/CDA1 family)
LIAGTKKIGKGEVLWINLPLSFLKRRTDGMLMHAFLRWISEDWLGLPRLLSVPNGKGGIVLNVHVDSNAALPYLDKLKNEGFFSDGPFSIHITAGPDAREPGDGLGFDLPKNKKSQEWVRYFIKHGHQVGSHGGWIHDYFGLHLTEKETPEFKDDLEKNYEAIKKAAGSAPVEYSAPLGNQPIWVNSWLRNRGYQSYYFVGDNGMGPTQNFRDTEFTDRGLWSFPVASYLQAASFEEADDQKIPEKEFTSWLIGLSHYVADHQNARLFYFHPPGIRFYVGALARWRKENRELIHQHRFEWYTMAGLTQFLNARTEVVWKIDALKVEHEFELSAKGCDKLHEMVWRFPKKTIKNVKVVSGHAQVTEKAQTIEVQPEDDHEIKVQYEEVQDAI